MLTLLQHTMIPWHGYTVCCGVPYTSTIPISLFFFLFQSYFIVLKGSSKLHMTMIRGVGWDKNRNKSIPTSWNKLWEPESPIALSLIQGDSLTGWDIPTHVGSAPHYNPDTETRVEKQRGKLQSPLRQCKRKEQSRMALPPYKVVREGGDKMTGSACEGFVWHITMCSWGYRK